MDSSRRRILQLLGLSSLALTARPVFNAFAKEEHDEKPGQSSKIVKTL